MHASTRTTPYLLMIPGLLLMLGVLYPFLNGVRWSLSTVDGSGAAHWVGLRNFTDMFRPGQDGYEGLLTTLKYAAAAVTAQMTIGLAVALLLTWPARWVRVFRTLIVIPLLLPPVVATIMWKVMLVDKGVANAALNSIGIGNANWLGSPTTAFWTTVMIETWLYTPFAILLLLAGLQSVPEEVLEAARVDGAGALRTFWHVYLPMLRPFLIIVLVFRGIDSLKSFEVIWTATQGGPLNALETLHVHGYQYAIQFLDIGHSMTFLVVLWILTYGLSFVLLKRRRAEGAAT
jgi:multiple sugar transport system permease protein